MFATAGPEVTTGNRYIDLALVVVFVGGVFLGVTRKAYRWWRGVDRSAQSASALVNHATELVDLAEIAPALKSIAALAPALTDIAHTLSTNSGSSIADRINGTHVMVMRLAASAVTWHGLVEAGLIPEVPAQYVGGRR